MIAARPAILLCSERHAFFEEFSPLSLAASGRDVPFNQAVPKYGRLLSPGALPTFLSL
jgi:hypothetical protein